MSYFIEIRKFLYGQYFFGGLRIAVGVSLPAILSLIVLHDRDLGFTISTGALGACAVDMPGPIKHKHNEMLSCSIIGFLAVLVTGLATSKMFVLWLTIVPVTFMLSLIVVYGNHWTQISFAALFMMTMTLEEKLTPIKALVNALWMLSGGLWYTYWATIVVRWKAYRIEKQTLAESLFSCANYLCSRAAFYDSDLEIDECYRNLIAKQIKAVETQEAARDIILRNLPKLRNGKLNSDRKAIFNLFTNTVDLHDLFFSMHINYALLRDTFGNSDLMIFYRDLLRKAAIDLEETGLAVLENRIPNQAVGMKAELRAIEYEIELMRKKNFQKIHFEAYASVLSTFRRMWSAIRLIERIHQNLAGNRTLDPKIDPKIDKMLGRFLQHRNISPFLIFSNLNVDSPSFRHALRVTISVAVGFWFGYLLPLTNAYWIVITSIVILKPNYSLTKQRNTQRIIGTLLGCVISTVLIYMIKNTYMLIAIMFASMVMSYSLLLFSYGVSVVFTSSYVLLMFYLLAPGNLRFIGERAIDTIIGCIISIVASRLLPYLWEYRMIGKHITNMLTAMRKYFETIACSHTIHDNSKSNSLFIAIGRPLIRSDYQYRLARRKVHITFANLGQAFQRMMLEPKVHQRYVAELNNLLIQAHLLSSQITAIAPLIRSLYYQDQQPNALQRVLEAVLENLKKAEIREPPSTDHLEITKILIRDLEMMVVESESEADSMTILISDIKEIAYQCKQMLSSSLLIRKYISVIEIPY
ncbi:MAG: FUSC family membrane protein [Burkholderia sp.]|nr:FUSC family membrane protein [Burkholderia sp.]